MDFSFLFQVKKQDAEPEPLYLELYPPPPPPPKEEEKEESKIVIIEL